MSTFATSNSCCMVQQTVFCSLPCFGRRPCFGAHSIAGNGRAKNHQCERSTSILYRGNQKKTPKKTQKTAFSFCFIFFSLGPRGSSWVRCIFCTFFLLCLRFGAGVLVKLTRFSAYHHSILPYAGKGRCKCAPN